MSQVEFSEGQHHRTRKSGVIDSAAVGSMADLNDSIYGDGDGFSAASHGVIGSLPSKSSSGLLFKEPMLGLTTDINRINTLQSACKSGYSLHERKPFTGKEHQNLNTNHAWKLASANPRQEHHSLGKQKPGECADNNNANSTFAHEVGFHYPRDGSEAETMTEIVGEVTELSLFADDCLGTENTATDTDAAWEKETKGIGQWDRSTVLSLALFVGLRLCYEALYGKMNIFGALDEGGNAGP
ncbi:hypothetical protein ACOMHN_027170 [Nucella lapillus]